MISPPPDSDVPSLASERSPARRAADAVVRLALRVVYRILLAYWTVARPWSRGVYVFAWWRGHLLLVRHAYKPRLFVPGGGLKPGEAFPDAAARELREEAGIAVEPSRLSRIGQLVNRHEHKHDVVDVYEVELDGSPAIRIDGREIVWAGFRPASELASLDLSPLTEEFLRALRLRGPA